MPGLAASRHAPRPCPQSSGPVNANLTVPPARTGGEGNIGNDGAENTTTDLKIHRSFTSSASSATSPSPSWSTTTATTTTTTTTTRARTTTTTTTAAPSPTGNARDARNARNASGPHELARYAKIVRRLQWKLPFLAQGYRRAVDRVGADRAAVAEAELMFKLDFFEYYMLLERALVHLLAVFGVVVWRRRPRQHRYHANVLAALDRPDNPLHGPLGTGEVRAQLRRAKDLRNRWKTAADDDDDDDEEEEEGEEGEGEDYGNGNGGGGGGGGGDGSSGARPGRRRWRTRKVAAPLDSYGLEHMLEVIFRGFDEAFRIAEEHVRRGTATAEGGDVDMAGEEEGRMMDWTAIGDEEEQWEFMVDAMDWEAV
ncbi:hypothetical protein VTH06DRAFT_6707 [Thermothelomyces fergusii]